MDDASYSRTEDQAEGRGLSPSAFRRLLQIAVGNHLWSRPLGRAQEALDEVSELLGKGASILTEYEYCAPKDHLRALQRLRAVPQCIVGAAAQLGTAKKELQAALELAEIEYRCDGGSPPPRLAAVVARYQASEARVRQFADRMTRIAANFKENLLAAIDFVAISGVLADLHALIASLEPAPFRSFLQFRRIKTADTLWTRRRRSRSLRIADAPRRISRGRAPPSASTCPL